MNSDIAFIVAGLGAVAYGCATFLQAVSARRADDVAHLDPRLLLRLLRSWPYVCGLTLDLAGFVATVVALQRLPLFSVQAIGGASVGVTALLAHSVLRQRLVVADAFAIVALGIGLVTLSLAAKPTRGTPLGTQGGVALAAASIALAVVAIVAARRASGGGGMALAVVTGLAFAGVSIAARGLRVPSPWWHLLATPGAIALAAYGVLAAVTLPVALQRAPLTAASAVMLVGETVVPAVVGVAALGDSTRGVTGASAAAIGFAVALMATLRLARYAAL